MVRQIAETAGLGLAFQLFPDDVRAAVAQVEKQRQVLRGDVGQTDEPWPPMRVPGT
jgi:hypothetical protein